MNKLFSIGEVAEAVGVATSALRHYDQIGLLPPATRISGQRRYTEEDLARLRVINDCRQAGFTLEEIGVLLDGEQGWQALAHRKRDELQTRIAQLTDAARLIDAVLACDCEHLEGCAVEDRHRPGGHRPGGHRPPEPLTDPTRSLLPRQRFE